MDRYEILGLTKQCTKKEVQIAFGNIKRKILRNTYGNAEMIKPFRKAKILILKDIRHREESVKSLENYKEHQYYLNNTRLSELALKIEDGEHRLKIIKDEIEYDRNINKIKRFINRILLIFKNNNV
jgi:hypothetical protein